MLVDYIFQVTFFGAIMVYGGMREDEGGIKAYFRWKKTPPLVGNVNKNEGAVVDPAKLDEELDRSFHERKLLIRFQRCRF
jgi:hypothetical protein